MQPAGPGPFQLRLKFNRDAYSAIELKGRGRQENRQEVPRAGTRGRAAREGKALNGTPAQVLPTPLLSTADPPQEVKRRRPKRSERPDDTITECHPRPRIRYSAIKISHLHSCTVAASPSRSNPRRTIRPFPMPGRTAQTAQAAAACTTHPRARPASQRSSAH
jgi:hypothetical protein